MTDSAALPDALTPFVLEHAAVRGAHVALAHTVRAALASHPYPPALARVLAELLAACALLTSTLKFSGSLIAQLTGNGPVRLLVVECTDARGLRATAQWDEARTAALGPDATLAELAGGPAHARFVLTLDPKGAGTIYQGIVALEGGSVAALIEHYLATSEQLASRLVLAASGDGVSGLLVQRLPGGTESDEAAWQRVRDALSANASSALRGTAPAMDVIAAVLPHEDVRVFKSRPVAFACSCSRERVVNALRIAGRDEVESILEERGSVEVTCEFCNRRYTFAAPEARAIFAPPADVPRH